MKKKIVFLATAIIIPLSGMHGDDWLDEGLFFCPVQTYEKSKSASDIFFESVAKDTALKNTKKLLRKGADPNLTVIRVMWGLPEFVALTPLLHALEHGAVRTVRVLLKAGANPRFTQSTDQWTIVHFACWFAAKTENRDLNKKYVNGVRLLLRYGADPNAQDKLGQTPLFECVNAGKKVFSLMKLLLLWGADMAIKDVEKRNAIVLAEGHNVQAAQFLKDWGEGKIKFRKKKIR